MRSTDPLRSWSEDKHLFADVVDALYELTWALGAYDASTTEPPRVTRPRDVLAGAAMRVRSGMAKDAIEHGGWEEA